MKHSTHTYLPANESRVSGKFEQGLRGCSKQDVVDDSLIRASKAAQLFRQSESDEKVMSLKQQTLLLIEPLISQMILTLGTVTIFAGVIALARLSTFIAVIEPTAKGRSAAVLNISHSAKMRGQLS